MFERGWNILRAIRRTGLVLAPELVEWTAPVSIGNPTPIRLLQQRICFTELQPHELPAHSERFGPFAIEFDVTALRRAGALPVVYMPQALPAKAVRPFVRGNKNDTHDARAIWTAARQPGVKTVTVKNEEQQAVLAMHRMRQQLVKFRTAQINGLRGLLAEYGEVLPQGRAGMRRGIADALERVSERLPAMVIDTLREQWERIGQLDLEIGEIERRIKLWHRTNPARQRVANSNRLKCLNNSVCSRYSDLDSCKW